jgi:chemotaxis signal transduction protein
MTQPLPKSSPLGDASPLNISQGQFVVFMIGGIGYAFPLNQVEEITQPPQTDSVPNVPGWVLGTAKVNDTALPVIDLRRFFRIRSHTKPALERLLVVHNATEKTRAGLIVDEVKAIRSIPNGEITPLKDSIQVNPTVRPYTYGHYDKIILLDIDRLFNLSDMAHIGLKTSS